MHNDIAEGVVLALDTNARNSLQWFRLIGKSRNEAETFALTHSAFMCSQHLCASMRFCVASSTQNGKTRCCRSVGLVREQSFARAGDVYNLLEENDAVMAIVEQKRQQRYFQHEARYGNWFSSTMSNIRRTLGFAPNDVNNTPIQHQHNSQVTHHNTIAPSVYPLAVATPPLATPVVAVAEWNPKSLLMENGNFIFDDEERKKKNLHISFVAPTGCFSIFVSLYEC